ncbi:MAG TPA: hypothetical protein PLO41_07630 [Rubrivivax sp.]|nr:hypothetical protein [Rubrivivax sp.]
MAFLRLSAAALLLAQPAVAPACDAAYPTSLATPLIGEVLTVGAPRNNVLWWRGMR